MDRILNGGKKKVKDTSCGVNPSSGRCKKGESKDKDLCTTNPKTNRCIKDKYSEANMYSKLKLGGGVKKVKDTSCGVNPSSGRCKKGESKDKDLCTTNPTTNRCIKDKYSEANMYSKLKLGGVGKKVKDTSCGVNPSSGRCKKGESKDKDLCTTNLKTNRCIKDKYSEANMYSKLKLDGGAKKVKDTSCGVNPSSGRCKKGESKDKDLCATNPKTNRCIKDKYSEANMYSKLKLG
jgi:hypothetical protein